LLDEPACELVRGDRVGGADADGVLRQNRCADAGRLSTSRVYDA
jgi:hypothetical protein